MTWKPSSDYRPKATLKIAKILDYVIESKGEEFTCIELARKFSADTGSLRASFRMMLNAGLLKKRIPFRSKVKLEAKSKADSVYAKNKERIVENKWSATEKALSGYPYSSETPGYQTPKQKSALEKVEELDVKRLRGLFFNRPVDLEVVSKGTDPSECLDKVLAIADKILKAKSHSRFNGSEVDLLVKRELRSITEAAELALKVLEEAFDIMGVEEQAISGAIKEKESA